MLMVTNLSTFPSSLTVIPVPGGDIRSHREDFIVNENLKRLGCSGRSGLSMATPAGATQAKFHQLYKTSDRLPLYSAVIELVKLCQVALIIFGKLEQEYADGLLCDVTEKAVNDWWVEIGSDYYNIEPSDGILGPTTVAGLLGMLMGARNRLNYFGAPVAKDVFDIVALKRGIAYFQKSQKLERTRRLDRQTLDRLHRVTAKAAAGEGWGVPKAVKSTVAELSSKGGEMMMGMVGSRDKAGISDIETLDIDHFISLLHGERSKWLWYGKSRKSGGIENSFGKSLPDMSNMIFSKDDHGGYVWSTKKSDANLVDEDSSDARRKEAVNEVYSTPAPGSATSMVEPRDDKDQHLRKAVFKSVTGKMNDARSGFGRIKDAVGLRGHASKHSRDDMGMLNPDGELSGYFSPSSSTLAPSGPTPGIDKAFTWKDKPREYSNGYRKEKDPVAAAMWSYQRDPTSSPIESSKSPIESSKTSLPFSNEGPVTENSWREEETDAKWAAEMKEIRQALISKDPSIAGSVCDDADLEGPFLEAERDPHSAGNLLRRRHSASDAAPRVFNDDKWPRHLSFSGAEEAILRWEDIAVLTENINDEQDNFEALQKQQFLANDFKRLHDIVYQLDEKCKVWVENKLQMVEGLETKLASDAEEIRTLYYQLSAAHVAVEQNSTDLIAEERSHIMEHVKDIEVLGAKLEYEINALISKVEDVEDGVAQFERQIDDIEVQADEMEVIFNNETWMHWCFRTLTGSGFTPAVSS